MAQAKSQSRRRPAPETLRVLSWNVNGLRAVEKKGFLDWLRGNEAFFAGIQEVRAHEEQLSEALRAPEGHQLHLVAAERKGYSGVAAYYDREPCSVDIGLGDAAFDAEGRVHLLRFGRLTIVNAYFPNGNGKNRDNSRVPFKLEFYRRLLSVADEERGRGQRVLIMGDYNTAHRAMDLARPKTNLKTSGFLPEEREELDRWVEAGWVDSFRHFEPAGEHYSWWSQRSGCRERNIGWRIDYVFACPEAMPFVSRAFIQPEVMGSDHCPVGVEVASSILL